MSIALVFASRRRLRAADLAAQFSVSERTVYRDVRALQRAGFPIEGSAGDGYRVAQGAWLRPLALGEAEAASLIMGADLLGASADPPLKDRLASATAKLESTLSAEVGARVRRQRAGVFVSTSGRRPAGPLGLVMSAIDTREVLHLRSGRSSAYAIPWTSPGTSWSSPRRGRAASSRRSLRADRPPRGDRRAPIPSVAVARGCPAK